MRWLWHKGVCRKAIPQQWHPQCTAYEDNGKLTNLLTGKELLWQKLGKACYNAMIILSNCKVFGISGLRWHSLMSFHFKQKSLTCFWTMGFKHQYHTSSMDPGALGQEQQRKGGWREEQGDRPWHRRSKEGNRLSDISTLWLMCNIMYFTLKHYKIFVGVCAFL